MLKSRNTQHLLLIAVTLLILNYTNYTIQVENNSAIKENTEVDISKEMLIKTNSYENSNVNRIRNVVYVD